MDDAPLPHASDVAETASHQAFVSERDRAAGLSARLVALGPRGLTEAETLELILARCLPRGAAPQSAAASLLARFGCIGRIVGADPVSLAAVIGRSDAKWGERPILLVELRDGREMSDDALIEPLQGRVAPWWIPESVIRLANMPLASTGKIDKMRLRAEYGQA